MEQLLQSIERDNRGWLRAGNLPPLRVYLDGVEINHVTATNRRKGIAEVADDPIRLDRWKKRVVTRRLYGHVTVEPIT